MQSVRSAGPALPTGLAGLPRLLAYTQTLGLEWFLFRPTRGYSLLGAGAGLAGAGLAGQWAAVPCGRAPGAAAGRPAGSRARAERDHPVPQPAALPGPGGARRG